MAPSARTETSIRGPEILPALIALRSPTSIKSSEPTSRTVVNPAISVMRAISDAISARSATGFFSRSISPCR